MRATPPAGQKPAGDLNQTHLENQYFTGAIVMSTIEITRIENYLEEKRSIVTYIEQQLQPLFKGLMSELENAAQALVGAPTSSKSYSEMVRVLHALGSPNSLYGYNNNALTRLRDILNVYAAGTGIRLLNTYMLESGMDEDEVNFSFECDPWRLLLSKELSSAHNLHTGAFIWVAHPNEDNAGVYVNELRHFELADLIVIRDTFEVYWNGALLWGKMRRSHLE